jgi:hypothetical protein
MSETEQAMSSRLQDDELIAAIVGKDATFYLEQWRVLSRNWRGWKWCSWNWMPAIFSAAWFGYRRMHQWALVFVLLWQIGPLIAVFLRLRHSDVEPNSLFLFSVIAFGVTGTLGDVIYLRHVRSIAADISSRKLTAEEREDLARRSGGVSWLGGLFWAAATIATELVIFYAGTGSVLGSPS